MSIYGGLTDFSTTFLPAMLACTHAHHYSLFKIALCGGFPCIKKVICSFKMMKVCTYSCINDWLLV